MAKTIYIQYTNPTTGAMATKAVSVDMDRFRQDTEHGTTENFFLKATASGLSDMVINIDDLIVNLLDGKPSHPKYGVVQSLVDTNFTANGTTLSVTPAANTAGFVEDVPCVVLDKFGSVKGWFIPTTVAADFTIPAANEGALAVDVKVGWIVQQAQSFSSSLGLNSQLGIKSQSERPAAATAVTGSGTVVGGITIGFTKSSSTVVAYYDVYCIKSATEPTVIEPNDIPSVADRAASEASTAINLTQYFNETTMVLTALDAGTYFVGVVAKDAAGMVDVNESAIAWSPAITIA